MSLNPKLQAMVEIGHYLQRKNYNFITVTPQTHHYYLHRHRGRLATNLRDVFGWCLPFDPSLLDKELWQWVQQADVVETHALGVRSRIRWASLGERLFVHSGYPTEEQDAVFFGPDTYRFVHAIDDFLRGTREDIRTVVDIGCGSGAGATYLASRLPDAAISGVDINPRALDYTSVNLSLANMRNVTTQRSNLLVSVDGCFDLIVANPPYMNDPQSRAYRHGGAYKGAELSLAIVDTAMQRLAAGGTLVLYTGVAIVNGDDVFLTQLRHRVQNWHCRWNYYEIDADVFGEELLQDEYHDVERIAAVALTLRKLG